MVNPCELKVLQEISFKVVEASPDAMVVINEQGTIIIFNYQAELMFGYAREEVEGHPVEILLPEGIRDGHVQHRDGYFLTPRVREMGVGLTLEARHHSGKLFPVEIKLAPLAPVRGAGVHALAVVRRLSERKNSKVVSTTIKKEEEKSSKHEGEKQ